MNIHDILTEVIRSEGGFTNDPNDSAHRIRKGQKLSNGSIAKWDSACTNMGITQYTLSEWLGRQATVGEVRALDQETVRDIYEKRYYSDPRFHTLPTAIQPVIVDAGILYGQPTSTKMLQQVLNLAGFGPVDEDGVLGPRTRIAAEKASAAMGGYLVNALVERRIHEANEIVRRRPQNAKYLKGWTNRANRFRVEVPR